MVLAVYTVLFGEDSNGRKPPLQPVRRRLNLPKSTAADLRRRPPSGRTWLNGCGAKSKQGRMIHRKNGRQPWKNCSSGWSRNELFHPPRLVLGDERGLEGMAYPDWQG
jgi:hypothetical protein